ncbi:hypothetical protein E0I26_13170 [Flavobacterium rhamnosiphilum]|uniref:Uncharacterized protein n=1 Tax=Flavobacterium rhamnosiphilum TaxID=2541724 RepID=A0A4R5F5J2_9FLAO|nr:hypothetical protein [Flavobacterium rhamnosiphilum]TDE42810.1 hypothetical protein E0I26_13170 [Flavobacterium rhamnosiphilum]
MKKILIITFLTYSVIASAQTKKIQFVRGDYPSKDKFGWIKLDRSKVAREILNFRGACCDNPAPELMNAEVVNDTLYIDKAIEEHDRHDNVGICGQTIMLVIDTIEHPNYKKLIISYKKLKSTKNRKIPHIKG